MPRRSSAVRRVSTLLALSTALTLAVPATRAAEAHTTLDRMVPAASTATAARPALRTASPAPDADGYRWISYFRALGGLGPITRDATIEAQEAAHIRYLADHAEGCETDVHDELTAPAPGCAANPYATAAGKLAANNSNITRLNADVPDRVAAQHWFTAGFHALTLLEPRLRSTGYAAYYTPDPAGSGSLPYRFTAAVDVYRGRTGTYRGQTLAFPAPGAVSPLLGYTVGSESPEPFRDSLPGLGCHSWGSLATVSAPIVVQWPVGSRSPGAQGAATITDLTAGRVLPTCALTADDYPVGSLARTFLSGTNRVTQAALYYTDAPFQAGHRYRLTIGSEQVTSFATSPAARAFGEAGPR